MCNSLYCAGWADRSRKGVVQTFKRWLLFFFFLCKWPSSTLANKLEQEYLLGDQCLSGTAQLQGHQAAWRISVNSEICCQRATEQLALPPAPGGTHTYLPSSTLHGFCLPGILCWMCEKSLLIICGCRKGTKKGIDGLVGGKEQP